MKLRKFTCAVGAILLAATAFALYSPQRKATDRYDRHGVMVAHNTDRPVVYMVFSADSMFEGAPHALNVLERRGIKASFFFTGNFLRDTVHKAIINRIINGGHYVGGHSDGHILLADWDDKRTPLVTDDSMLADVRRNLALLESFGIRRDSCRWFMPPFEWIAAPQVPVLRDSLGLEIINPTPGIQIFRDYTTPGMPDYHSSDSILRQLYDFESRKGLNGVFLIIHLGTQDVRTDKLYLHLDEILDTLAARGYTLARLH